MKSRFMLTVRQVQREHQHRHLAGEHLLDGEGIPERVPLGVGVRARRETRVDVPVHRVSGVGHGLQRTAHPDDLADALLDRRVALPGADEGRQRAEHQYRELRAGAHAVVCGSDQQVLRVGGQPGIWGRHAPVEDGRRSTIIE